MGAINKWIKLLVLVSVYKLVEYFLHYFSIIDIAVIDWVYQECDSKSKNPDGVTTQIKTLGIASRIAGFLRRF